MIDCHAHLTSKAFAGDLDIVVDNARKNGITHIIVVSENMDDAKKAMELAKRYDGYLLPAAGIHPDVFSEENAPFSVESVEMFCEFVRRRSSDLSCIGEVGLDYWYVKTEERRKMQRAFLRKMASLSNETRLPLNIHSRSAGKYTLDLLIQEGAKRVLMHGFDGKAGHALKAHEEHGFFFSVPTSVVRSVQKQKLVRVLPLKALVLETDSPVLGPVRDKRNEPANLIYALKYIAEAKKTDIEIVKETTTNTAKRLFKITN